MIGLKEASRTANSESGQLGDAESDSGPQDFTQQVTLTIFQEDFFFLNVYFLYFFRVCFLFSLFCSFFLCFILLGPVSRCLLTDSSSCDPSHIPPRLPVSLSVCLSVCLSASVQSYCERAVWRPVRHRSSWLSLCSASSSSSFSSTFTKIQFASIPCLWHLIQQLLPLQIVFVNFIFLVRRQSQRGCLDTAPRSLWTRLRNHKTRDSFVSAQFQWPTTSKSSSPLRRH